MLDFNPLRPEDTDRILPLIRQTPGLSCEYSPACLMMWGNAEFAPCGDFYVLLVTYGGHKGYLRPIGGSDFQSILPELEADAKARGIPFRMFGITPSVLPIFEEAGRYRFETNRDYYDYIYTVQSLTTLSGSKLQAKRNHINRFLSEHEDWCCEPISNANIDECRELCEQWYTDHAEAGMDISVFEGERHAISFAFDNYATIGFDRMALRTGGRIIAFSMGNRFSTDTYDVNFEKAIASVQGAYALINREFSRMIHEKYPEIVYLNREDDMGLPGLRKAKLSYHPALILEKYNAVLREDFR